MRGDNVKLNLALLENARRQKLLGKKALYKFVGIHWSTGAKIYAGGTIHLVTALKIAKALKININDLIESWA